MMLALGGCRTSTDATRSTTPHPDNQRATVEYFVEHPHGKGPWPTVVLLHGHQDATAAIGGRAYVNWGVLKRFARKGYLAVSVSLPGYGGSDGPRDFAGRYTQRAVGAVIEKLVVEQAANPDKLLIEGVSLGAVTGALVAADNPRLSGLVLISGLYDFPAFFNPPKTAAAMGIKASLVQQTGGSDAALRARSALYVAPRIRAATLILNGARDDRTDPAQALKLADAINTHGGRARAIIFPEFGHEIPVAARDTEIDAFIETVLRR